MNFAAKDKISRERFEESDWCWSVIFDFKADGNGVLEAKEELIFTCKFKQVVCFNVILVEKRRQICINFGKRCVENLGEDFELILFTLGIMDLNYFELILWNTSFKLYHGLTRDDISNFGVLAFGLRIFIMKVYDDFFIMGELEASNSMWSIVLNGSEKELGIGVEDQGWPIHGRGFPSSDSKGIGLVDKHTDTCELVVIDQALVLGISEVQKTKIIFRHKLY